MESQKSPNIVQIIENYIQGNVNAEDEKILLSWLKENPENEKLLFGEKDIWETSKIGSKSLNEIETQQWIELEDEIMSRKFKIKGIYEILKIAAIVLIALGAGWMAHSLFSSSTFLNKHVEQKFVTAYKGQVKEIFLADGTHVWLNSDSRLSFPSNFTEDNRKVELRGEAYFEVTANEKNPFIVKTIDHKVKVTGTKFNICEYPESRIIKTTLVEGKVKIITGNITKDLWPGQQSSFNTESAQIRISKKDFEIYTSWKDGRYEFRNEPIGKVFQIIERWYDVQINYPKKEMKNERISGVLKRHKPIANFLEVIEKLIPIKYEIGNDIINIETK